MTKLRWNQATYVLDDGANVHITLDNQPANTGFAAGKGPQPGPTFYAGTVNDAPAEWPAEAKLAYFVGLHRGSFQASGDLDGQWGQQPLHGWRPGRLKVSS